MSTSRIESCTQRNTQLYLTSKSYHQAAGTFPFESKHTFILHKDHALIKLIVQYFHERACHIGQEQTFAEINERFCVVRGP